MKSFYHLRGKYILATAFCSLILVISALAQTEAQRKPSIAVIQFSASGKASAGTELADLLINELINTNKFSVADRSKSIAIESELLRKALKVSIDQATAAEIALQTGARYLVLGNVIEYGEKQKTSLFGVNSYEGVVKFNLRAVDSTTAEVIFSQTFEKRGVSLGQAKDGAIMGNFGSKAMQDAVSRSLKDAVTALVKRFSSPPSVSPSTDAN